jgi:hypothetical protein
MHVVVISNSGEEVCFWGGGTYEMMAGREDLQLNHFPCFLNLSGFKIFL